MSPRATAWKIAAALAILWPSRLSGVLDGVPLDTPVEVVAIGILLPWLLVFGSQAFRSRATRGVAIALLAWKGLTGAALTQDGWCLTFTTPAPFYLDSGVVPHSWDIRADWRSPAPMCSAIMTRPYGRLEAFPVWFYNLPPADAGQAQPGDRPPLASARLSLTGVATLSAPAALRVDYGRALNPRVSVDGADVTGEALAAGHQLASGSHDIEISAAVTGSDWRLSPVLDDEPVWSRAIATLTAPSALDRWVRPWGRGVAPLLVLSLVGLLGIDLVQRVRHRLVVAYALAASAVCLLLWNQTPRLRFVPLLLFVPPVLEVPARLRNTFGAFVLIGLPWLLLFAARGASEAGTVTFYTSGDDWWMFQRYAYRIFLQGYWLEGGQVTFWFQPLYRWIAGALHLMFGDSSVGELCWDASCVLVAALFSFRVVKSVAGHRWGLAAAALTCATFTIGPAWYLFGRGLSEISSTGFLYAGALFLLRARSGSWTASAAAGTCATLAFYTRLNNLPMAAAIAAFAWPLRLGPAAMFSIRIWRRRVAWRAAAGVAIVLLIGILLFAARTWYYTGVFSVLYGTQADALKATARAESIPERSFLIVQSVLMVLSMNDPPRFDLRALPLAAGFAAAVLGLVRIRPFDRLPAPPLIFLLSGLVSSVFTRGNGYSGRFSVHLIPVGSAIVMCMLAHFTHTIRPAFRYRAKERHERANSRIRV